MDRTGVSSTNRPNPGSIIPRPVFSTPADGRRKKIDPSGWGKCYASWGDLLTLDRPADRRRLGRWPSLVDRRGRSRIGRRSRSLRFEVAKSSRSKNSGLTRGAISPRKQKFSILSSYSIGLRPLVYVLLVKRASSLLYKRSPWLLPSQVSSLLYLHTHWLRPPLASIAPGYDGGVDVDGKSGIRSTLGRLMVRCRPDTWCSAGQRKSEFA